MRPLGLGAALGGSPQNFGGSNPGQGPVPDPPTLAILGLAAPIAEPAWGMGKSPHLPAPGPHVGDTRLQTSQAQLSPGPGLPGG